MVIIQKVAKQSQRNIIEINRERLQEQLRNSSRNLSGKEKGQEQNMEGKDIRICLKKK